MEGVVPLSEAKARLSELVQHVRSTGEVITITVDGEPAVEVSPISAVSRPLTPSEVALDRALHAAVLRLMENEAPFDAVDLIRDGRR